MRDGLPGPSECLVLSAIFCPWAVARLAQAGPLVKKHGSDRSNRMQIGFKGVLLPTLIPTAKRLVHDVRCVRHMLSCT